jgi:hypothetical protein
MKKRLFFWLVVLSTVLFVVCVVVGVSLIRNNELTKVNLSNDKTNNEAWLLLGQDSETLRSMQALLMNGFPPKEQWLAYKQLKNFDDKFIAVYSSNEDQFWLVLEGKMEIKDLLIPVDEKLFSRVSFLIRFAGWIDFISFILFIVSCLGWFNLCFRKLQKIEQEAIKKSEEALRKAKEEAIAKGIKIE